MKPQRPKYQVFVSSTYSDLSQEREAVTWEILTARHIPAGMENFTASNDRGWKIIQRVIDDSDYYVLIIAGKYGSINESTGKSWTQLEYEYATSKGVPVMAFIREKSAITANKMEEDSERREKLDQFIVQVKSKHLVKWWTSQEDLVAKVSAALRNQIQDDEHSENPRPGWYRGNTLPSAAALEEFARLSAENAQLQKELEDLRKILSPRLTLLNKKGDKVCDHVVIHPSLPMNPGTPPSEHRAYLDRRNRTYWLQLAIHNNGEAAARDVVVDLDIEDVEVIRLYEEEPPPTSDPLGRMSSLLPRNRATDPKEHTYVDGYHVSERIGRIRQRVKSVAPGFVEGLQRVGLQGPLNTQEFCFRVRYRIAHSSGRASTGEFMITVRFDPSRNMIQEMHEQMSARFERNNLEHSE